MASTSSGGTTPTRPDRLRSQRPAAGRRWRVPRAQQLGRLIRRRAATSGSPTTMPPSPWTMAWAASAADLLHGRGGRGQLLPHLPVRQAGCTRTRASAQLRVWGANRFTARRLRPSPPPVLRPRLLHDATRSGPDVAARAQDEGSGLAALPGYVTVDFDRPLPSTGAKSSSSRSSSSHPASLTLSPPSTPPGVWCRRRGAPGARATSAATAQVAGHHSLHGQQNVCLKAFAK